MSMCPKNDELDVNRRNFGQVEPTPEPAPDIPEEPNGDEEEAGNEDSCLILFLDSILA